MDSAQPDYRSKMTMEFAEQIASLLNERNQLTTKQDGQDIYEKGKSYDFEIRAGKVVACIQRIRLQWYQWEIRHLSVSEDHEGAGLAYGLYKKAEGDAITGRARLLQCTIREGNVASERFFTRQGFKRVNSFGNEKSGHRVWVWQKVLSEASRGAAELNKARYIAGGAAIIPFVISLVLIPLGWLEPLPKDLEHWTVKTWQVVFWLAWSIVPPGWFVFENWLFGRQIPAPEKDVADRFKYNQDLASKVWIAIAAALLVLYFGKEIRPPSEDVKSKAPPCMGAPVSITETSARVLGHR